MSQGSQFPPAEFNNAPLLGPAPGLQNDEVDTGDLFRANADLTNEGNKKMQWLLSYLGQFTEKRITDLNGRKHVVLTRAGGAAGGEGAYPFAASVSGDGAITIGNGMVLYYDGADPALPGQLDWDSDVDTVEITGLPVAGSIYLHIQATFYSSVNAVAADGAALTLARWIPDTLVGLVSTLPLEGNDWGDIFNMSGPAEFYWKLVDFETVDGELTISKAYVRDNITFSEWALGSDLGQA